MYKVNSVKGTSDYRTSAIANFLRKNANIHPVRQDLLDEYVPVILEHLETLENIKPTYFPSIPAYTRVEALPNTSVAYQFGNYESFEKFRLDAKRGLESSPLYQGIDKFSPQELAEGRFKGVNGDDNRLKYIFSIIVNYTQSIAISLNDIIENGYSKYNIEKFMRSYNTLTELFSQNGAYTTVAGESRSNSILNDLESFGLLEFYKKCEKFLNKKSLWQSRVEDGQEVKPYVEKEVISIVNEDGQKDEQLMGILGELYQEATSSRDWVIQKIKEGEMRTSSDNDAEKILGVSIFDLSRISDNLLKLINNGYLNKDDYMELIDLMRSSAEEIQTGYREFEEASPLEDQSSSGMDWRILFTGTDIEKDIYLKSVGFESGLKRVNTQYKSINNFFSTTINKFYEWKKHQMQLSSQKAKDDSIDAQDFYEFVDEFYNVDPNKNSNREWIQTMYDRETIDAANNIVTQMVQFDDEETDTEFYKQDDFKKLVSRVQNPIQSYSHKSIIKSVGDKEDVDAIFDRIKNNKIGDAQEAMAFLDDCNELVKYLKKPEDFNQSADGLDSYALLLGVMEKKNSDHSYLFLGALNDLVEEIATFDENLDNFFGKGSRYRSTRSKKNRAAKDILSSEQIMAMENYEKIKRDLSYFYETVKILIERVDYARTDIDAMEATGEESINLDEFRQKYEGILRVVHSNLSYLMKFAYDDSISNIFQSNRNKSFFKKYNDVIYYINFVLEYISPHVDPSIDMNSIIENLSEIKTKLKDFLFLIESIVSTLPEESAEQTSEEMIDEEAPNQGDGTPDQGPEKETYFGWSHAPDTARYIAPIWKDLRANIEALMHEYLNNNVDKKTFVAEVRNSIVPHLTRMETIEIGGIARKSLNNMSDIIGRRLLTENSEVIINNYM